LNRRIHPNEREIAGGWTFDGGSALADTATRRIEDLISSHLTELSRTDDGWSVLYQDPDDNRMWELTYPNSDSQGGGAPHLQVVDRTYAASKYVL
jgi:hypothetical protein